MSKALKHWTRLKKNKEDLNTCNFDEPAYEKSNNNKSAYKKDVLQGRQKSNWRSVEFFDTSQNQIP